MNRKPILLALALLALSSCGEAASSETPSSSSKESSASTSMSSESSSEATTSQSSSSEASTSERTSEASSEEPSSSQSSEEPSSSEPSSAEPSSEAPSSTDESSESSEDTKFDPADFENTLCIHYHRDDADYLSWYLWLWPKNGDGDVYRFTLEDSYGGVCVTPLSTFNADTIGVIVRDDSWKKDPDGDRFIELNTLTPDENGNYQVWLYTGVSAIYDEEPKNIAFLSTCAFADFTHVSVAAGAGKLYGLELFEDGVSVEEVELAGVTSYKWELEEPVRIDAAYSIRATFANQYTLDSGVAMTGVYTDPAFDELYRYDGELGAIYAEDKTVFRVWSPASTSIELRIYDTGTPQSLADGFHPGSDTPVEAHEMLKGEKGVFSFEVPGDLDGFYYTYFVKNYLYPDGKEVVDPYARSAGVNGLRGMILDLEKTDPEGFRDFTLPAYDRLASVVYESHIADLTSSETWGGNPDNAKKYAGFHEEGSEYEGVATGFDHVKELGVTAVQILPMFDQANDEVNVEFNWGYNPLNYNVPEGCYSSDPYDGAVRVRELKELVQAYGEAGISIIMDVVYNHVNSVSGQNFDVLMPYYYFRYNGTALYNGSGCGNETASERSMFRKFMIDSATYWSDEYRLGGFRFDLMGLHDLDTMALLTDAVEEINPDAIIYGEPWAGGTSGLTAAMAANQSNMDKFDGYGCFNDRIRDGLIAGGLSDSSDKAWATVADGVTDSTLLRKLTAASKAGGAKLTSGILGGQIGSSDPNIAVSYASCHDNYTLYDRAIAAYGGNRTKEQIEAGVNGITDEQALRMNLLAQAVIMTSQGTAFMLSGEELLRSKGGNSNSYNASYEVNEIDYARKVAYPELFEDYKALIELKKTLPGLHLDLAEAKAKGSKYVKHTKDYSCLAYEVAGEDDDVYVVAHCNGIYAPEAGFEIDFGEGTIVFDSLHTENAVPSAETLLPYQTLIVKK